MNLKTLTTTELAYLLDKGPMFLFGTGFVARMFCSALKDRRSKIRYCLISKRNRHTEEKFAAEFPEIPILEVMEAPETDRALPLLVAVHESLLDEVEALLLENGFSNLIWIYPNVHELVFGKVLREECSISVKEIIDHQPEDEFWLEIRYLAVRDYFEGKQTGKRLYEKGMQLFSNVNTVNARKERIPVLAESMRKNGFLPEYPILIDERFRLIDGLHRLAAAAYLGIREIPCRVVAAAENYSKFIPANVRAKKDVLSNNGFQEEVFQMLENVRSQMRYSPEVSLILPIYNTSAYMEQCLESIDRQSFHDYEVILINDGSTDDSGLICERWEKQDPRFRFIDQENKGVSACRNLGVSLARAEFIGFIDPDDWIEDDYVETLYQTAVKEDADYVECDIFRYNEKTKKEVYRSVYGKMGIPYTLEEHMKYAPTASYKALFRKTLWTKNGIHMPPCAFESPAVYSLVLALADKVVNVPRPLYHYRVGRPDSLIENGYAAKDGSANNTLGTEAMAFLLSEFQRTGLFAHYRKTLEELVKYRLSDILATQFTRKNTDDYLETVSNFRACLKELFPDSRSFRYLNMSGYNLNRILAYLNQLHDPACRYNFSSVIAIVDTIGNDMEKQEDLPVFFHSNRYRKIMLERECKGSFFKVLKEQQPEYLFLDFIEERFDLLKWNGRLFTLSDALEGAVADWVQSAERISRNSEICAELWKKSFLAFRQEISRCSKTTKIVIVENYLSEKLGDAVEQREFNEVEKIREMNQILSSYYDYCKMNFADIIFVPAYTADLYFTDKDYEYGAVPSHLNEVVNKAIAKMIANRI